jgi:hypothetical protein
MLAKKILSAALILNVFVPVAHIKAGQTLKKMISESTETVKSNPGKTALAGLTVLTGGLIYVHRKQIKKVWNNWKKSQDNKQN